MKTIQEMLQELSQCIVTVSGEFRFRTNWNGGKVPQPDLDVFDPNVPFCIENVGDVPVEIGLYNTNGEAVRSNCKISTNLKTWSDYNLALTNDGASNDIGRILLQNKGDRVYIKADKNPLGSYVPQPYPHTKFKVFNPSSSKKIRARGNIASLNHGSNDLYKTDYLTYIPVEDSYCYYSMFGGCASLVQAPELPATTLAKKCYDSMFQSCKSLAQAPELPATTLADECYSHMFWYCTSLTQAPELPATTLANHCYDHMFADCKSFTQAPELPATVLAEGCYASMFSYCPSLVQAPELPATNLAYECYYDMFGGCASLVQAPELPATTLAAYCYRRMFGGCASLTQAPELPATTLADGCYYEMFSNCTKLNYVKCLATDTSASSCITNWLYGVAYKGTFECDNKKYFTVDSPNGIPSGWTITEINPDPEKPDLDVFDPNVPFCIENVGDVPVEIGLYNYDKKNTAIVRTNCKISYDLKTWSDYTIVLTANTNSVDINKITLSNKGDRVYIKADKNKIDTTNLKASDIPSTRIKVINQSSETKIRARGNIASLNKGTNDAYKTNYLKMSTNDNLCYHSMFYDCTSLTQAPELPATKLLSWCYSHMFYGCTLLEVAPSLPSTTLANYCYENMFNRCTSLTQAPKLPATTLTNSCYSYMFELCKSLTQAPELPAATLIKYCYIGMFWGCSKLNYVKCSATSISAEHCTDVWLYEVSSTGDFYTPAATNWTSGANGIPTIWTRHDIT